MHLQLIWMNTSMFKKKHKTETSPLGLKPAFDLTENNYLKVNVWAMMLQSLLILEVYWVSESYQALAPQIKTLLDIPLGYSHYNGLLHHKVISSPRSLLISILWCIALNECVCVPPIKTCVSSLRRWLHKQLNMFKR